MKIYFEWDSDNSNYIFWNEDTSKDDGWHIEEDQFNNNVEKLEAKGYVVEEWEE